MVRCKFCLVLKKQSETPRSCKGHRNDSVSQREQLSLDSLVATEKHGTFGGERILLEDPDPGKPRAVLPCAQLDCHLLLRPVVAEECIRGATKKRLELVILRHIPLPRAGIGSRVGGDLAHELPKLIVRLFLRPFRGVKVPLDILLARQRAHSRHSVDKVVRAGGTGTQPDQDLCRTAVDGAHGGDLGGLFQSVSLVDADLVNPQRHGLGLLCFADVAEGLIERRVNRQVSKRCRGRRI